MEPSPSLPPSRGPAPAPGGPEPGRPAPAPARRDATATRRLGPLPLDQRTTAVATAALVLCLAVAIAGTGYRYEPFVDTPAAPSDRVPSDDRGLQQLTSRLRTRERELTARLRAAAPRGVYIVIDQTQNRLYLKRDDQTLLQAICSAGSGMVLRESSGKKREWVFDSPRGRFDVLSMSRNPVWRKPDWAFVEESQPIPRNPAERLDYGSLGEYALYFGNGFMIHGTLYERLLGRAVSHGCIRVGRDDLRQVWANARLGMHIYIY
jgi:L,D-transpeptidase ErfK/SrfK